MRQRFISGLLFMVLMIVVMHYAIPHHHHQDFVIYNAETHNDDQCSHSGDDPQPLQCLIQSINLDIPREPQTIRLMSQGEDSPYSCALLESILFSDRITGWTIVHAPPAGLPADVAFTDISARGPPC